MVNLLYEVRTEGLDSTLREEKQWPEFTVV